MKQLGIFLFLVLPASAFGVLQSMVTGFPFPSILKQFTNDLGVSAITVVSNESRDFIFEAGAVQHRLYLALPYTALAYSNGQLVYTYTLDRRTRDISKLKVVDKNTDFWN
jgi:hypothetical protein